LDPKQLQLAKQYFKRTKIFEEILETETSYVYNLCILIKKFQNPLNAISKSPDPFINTKDVKAIFSDLENIHSVNTILLECLNAKMKSWSSKQIIGDVFLHMADYLRSYTTYVNNYNSAIMTIAKCNSNRKFRDFIEKANSDRICRNLDLESFLIMPIQRVPRYSLLLRDLLKQTPTTHPDHDNLTEALKKIGEVNSYLNQQKAKADERTKLVNEIKTVHGFKRIEDIAAPNRRLILKQRVAFLNKGKTQCQGKLFIFNDGFLYTKTKKQKEKLVKLLLYQKVTDVHKDANGFLNIKTKKDMLKLYFANPQLRDTAFDKLIYHWKNPEA